MSLVEIRQFLRSEAELWEKWELSSLNVGGCTTQRLTEEETGIFLFFFYFFFGKIAQAPADFHTRRVEAFWFVRVEE